MSSPQQNPNLARLAAAAEKLEPLLDRIAFVGGCVTGLLLTDPAAAPVRPTLDVDAIVAVGSYLEFRSLEEALRNLGFHQSHTAAPICGWISGDLLVDLMPTDPSILGFSNRWYRPALENARRVKIGKHEVHIVTAPYFLATKLEAFHGRGNKDFQMNHDLEDIVTVIDGRPELAHEVHLGPADIQKYLSDEFGASLSNRDFLDALPGHLLLDTASQQRAGLILKRMKQLILEG